MLLPTALLVLLFATASVDATCKKPNILLILADDYGFNDIGYNNPDVITPVLDGLAAGGTTLDHAYSLPTCSPSRTALLTGKYPFRTGTQFRVFAPGDDGPMPVDLPLLPEKLQDKGYSTHLVGKWHVGDCSVAGLPTNRGFDTSLGIMTGATDHFTRLAPYFSGFPPQFYYDFFNGTDILPTDPTVYSQDIYEQEVIRLIKKNAEEDTPFFILHTTQLPHSPLQVPSEFLDMYSDQIEPNRRTYLGMVTAMDTSIGKMIDELDNSGVRDNTIVIFMSDNGGISNTFLFPTGAVASGNNYPLRGSKSTVYEGGVRVPALLNSPLLPKSAGKTRTGLFHITDWMPTILSLTDHGKGCSAGSSSESSSSSSEETTPPPHEVEDEDNGIDGIDQSKMFLRSFGKSRRKAMVIQLYDTFFAQPPENNNQTQVLVWERFKLIWGPGVPDSDNLKQFQNFTDQWSQPDEWRVSGRVEPVIDGTNCSQPNTNDLLCLFDIRNDPSETEDIKHLYPSLVSWMQDVLRHLQQDIQFPVNPNIPFTRPFSEVTDAQGNLQPGYCD